MPRVDVDNFSHGAEEPGSRSPRRLGDPVRALLLEAANLAASYIWQGRAVMRISVSSWATTEEDVERSVAAIIEAHRAG